MSKWNRMTGTRTGKALLVIDGIAIAMTALSVIMITYLLTWARDPAIAQTLEMPLIYISVMALFGGMLTIMTSSATMAWLYFPDIWRLIETMSVGIIAVSVIQIFTSMFSAYSFWDLDTTLAAMVMLPVATAEELFYRAFLFGALYKLLVHFGRTEIEGFTIAGVASSVVFGAGHAFVYGAENFIAIIGAMAAGFVFAYCYWRSRTLAVPVIIHFLNNFLVIMLPAVGLVLLI